MQGRHKLPEALESGRGCLQGRPGGQQGREPCREVGRKYRMSRQRGARGERHMVHVAFMAFHTHGLMAESVAMLPECTHATEGGDCEQKFDTTHTCPPQLRSVSGSEIPG